MRPVAKIGLVAPFEGLYRRTGYEALAALRAAIAESPGLAVDLLPLALDDSADPVRAQRAVEKLLRDPALRGVVGPLSPSLAHAVRSQLESSALAWVTPYAVEPTSGFAHGADDTMWAAGLVSAIAQAARTQGADRLLLAGWTPGWPDLSDEEWRSITDFPLQKIDETFSLDRLDATDAILWLGNAHDASLFLSAVREVMPSIPFWLGPQGGDPVFVEHADLSGAEYWAIWTDSGYNLWTETHAPATPTAYLTYLAARHAIARATDLRLQPSSDWQVQRFRFEQNGDSVPWALPD